MQSKRHAHKSAKHKFQVHISQDENLHICGKTCPRHSALRGKVSSLPNWLPIKARVRLQCSNPPSRCQTDIHYCAAHSPESNGLRLEDSPTFSDSKQIGSS